MEKQGTVEVETQLAHAIDQTEFDSRYDETAKKDVGEQTGSGTDHERLCE